MWKHYFFSSFLSGWNIPECWYRGKGLKLLVKCIKKYFESCHDMRLSVVFLKRSLKKQRLCNDENYHILILEISRYLSLCACFIDKQSQPMIINDFIRGDFSY